MGSQEQGGLTPGDQRIAEALLKKPRLLEKVLARVLLGEEHQVAGPWETWGHTSSVNENYESWTRRILFMGGELSPRQDFDGDICRVMQEEDDESGNLLSNQYHVTLELDGRRDEDLGWVNTPEEGRQRADERLREVGWLLLGDTT